MDDSMLILLIVSLLIGSLFGGLVLMMLARFIGKIPNAKFGNSFIVCFLASGINYLIWYIIGLETILELIDDLGLFGFSVFNILVLSALYIVIGKKKWKSTWLQSLKANFVWILLYAIGIGISFSQFT